MRLCSSESDFDLFKKIYYQCFDSKDRLPLRKLKRDYQMMLYQNDVILVLKQLGSLFHLEYLGVNPDSQGKGMGKKMLSLFPKVTLECREHLIPFYEKMGFHVLGKNKTYYFLYKGISIEEAKDQFHLFLTLNMIAEQLMIIIKQKMLNELIWFILLQTYFIFWFRDVSA